MPHQLAQVNIGRLAAPRESTQMAGFFAALDPVNAVADAAEGFVWRLQTEEGNATAVTGFAWEQHGDHEVLINMSVWASLQALTAFVSGQAHRQVLRQRRQWFEALAVATTCLWWVPDGHRPSVAEAEQRLLHLRAHGPTAEAFTFRQPFGPPAGTGSAPLGGETAPVARL
ncbi:MAG: DUF3291 domain-containing protein [Acidimicrobiales bacterium]